MIFDLFYFLYIAMLMYAPLQAPLSRSLSLSHTHTHTCIFIFSLARKALKILYIISVQLSVCTDPRPEGYPKERGLGTVGWCFVSHTNAKKGSAGFGNLMCALFFTWPVDPNPFKTKLWSSLLSVEEISAIESPLNFHAIIDNSWAFSSHLKVMKMLILVIFLLQ